MAATPTRRGKRVVRSSRRGEVKLEDEEERIISDIGRFSLLRLLSPLSLLIALSCCSCPVPLAWSWCRLPGPLPPRSSVPDPAAAVAAAGLRTGWSRPSCCGAPPHNTTPVSHNTQPLKPDQPSVTSLTLVRRRSLPVPSQCPRTGWWPAAAAAAAARRLPAGPCPAGPGLVWCCRAGTCWCR